MMTKQKKPCACVPFCKNIFENHFGVLLWSATGILVLALLFSRILIPDLFFISIIIGVLLLLTMFFLVRNYWKSLTGRSAAYGLNSAVTIILVIGIAGVINFLASRYPQKIDMTEGGIHTLSDQSQKIVKNAVKPVKAVLFAKTDMQQQKTRALLENYKDSNPGKFEIEYVDPDKEPTRAKQVGIKKYGTLQITVSGREQKIEDPDEEKITNAIIKLSKDSTLTVCTLTGHDEKDFESKTEDGYKQVKDSLEQQSYKVVDLNIIKEGKIPENCAVLTILGAKKAFFPKEVEIIKNYLKDGGRAVIAFDLNIGGTELVPELIPIVNEWFVDVKTALVVDPLSRLLGVDAAVPILATFSKEHPITKDFTQANNCYFPFTRPLEEISKNIPAEIKVTWLAKTTPNSWGETSIKGLGRTKVAKDPGDISGPITAAIAVEGRLKDSQAEKSTRLIVLGTSNFATNKFSRFGGNLDFFMNSVTWALEDESLISIREKQSGPGKVTLTQTSGQLIFWITVVLIPIFIAVGGIVIWLYRRKL